MILAEAKANLATIVNYDCKVQCKLKCTFMIIHYKCEAFIVQATGKILTNFLQVEMPVCLLLSKLASFK